MALNMKILLCFAVILMMTVILMVMTAITTFNNIMMLINSPYGAIMCFASCVAAVLIFCATTQSKSLDWLSIIMLIMVNLWLTNLLVVVASVLYMVLRIIVTVMYKVAL